MSCPIVCAEALRAEADRATAASACTWTPLKSRPKRDPNSVAIRDGSAPVKAGPGAAAVCARERETQSSQLQSPLQLSLGKSGCAQPFRRLVRLCPPASSHGARPGLLPRDDSRVPAPHRRLDGRPLATAGGRPRCGPADDFGRRRSPGPSHSRQHLGWHSRCGQRARKKACLGTVPASRHRPVGVASPAPNRAESDDSQSSAMVAKRGLTIGSAQPFVRWSYTALREAAVTRHPPGWIANSGSR